MNKNILFLVSFLFFNAFVFSQNTVFGYVKGEGEKPLEGVTVILNPSGKSVKTDRVGYFQFKDVPNGNYTLIYERDYYNKTEQQIVVSEKGNQEVKSLVMEYEPTNADVGLITLTEDQLNDDENESSQNSIGLLQASRDAFSRTSAFDWGTYRFRVRGLEARYTDVLFNGINMAKSDNGQVDFSNWGGLNDVTRFPYELAESNNPSAFTFGSGGGVAYFNTRASNYRKGTSIGYSFTNRSYFHRVMATHSTGMMKNGWAFTVSGSRRWAEEGFFDGTFQDRYAYFLSVEKKISDKHSLNLTTFGTPQRMAGNSPNTAEAWKLGGDRYNAYWGWQDGVKRNERVRKSFEPISILTHYWDINKNSKLTTSVSYQLGRDGRSRLDRYDALNPSPTYYRNMPSYQIYEALERNSPNEITINEQNLINQYVTGWQNGTLSQINWNDLYLKNKGVIADANGKRAIYYLAEDVNEDKTFNAATHFSTKINDNWKLYANLNYQSVDSDNFRIAKDLLGADYVLNADAFADDKTNNSFNVGGSSIARQGERVQYSFHLKRQQYYANVSSDINVGRFNIFASLFASQTESQRVGDFNHYLYATSKGTSEKYSSLDGGIKARVTYKINGKNFLVFNGGFQTITPTLNDIFINPRVNSDIPLAISSQHIFSNDLSYFLKAPKTKVRATLYYTQISKATEVSRFFTEGAQNDVFTTEVTTNVQRTHLGFEGSVEHKINSMLSAVVATNVGQYTYSNNPNVTLYADDLPNKFQDLGKATLKDYKIAGTPQKAFSLSLRYNNPKFWWIGVSGNYFMDNYFDISPILRTQSFVTDPTGGVYSQATEENLRNVLIQIKTDDQFIFNINGGKSFKFGQYRLGVSLMINNILNNRNFITGGYEAARYSNFQEAFADYNRGEENRLFPARYWKDLGISYFLNTYLRF